MTQPVHQSKRPSRPSVERLGSLRKSTRQLVTKEPSSKEEAKEQEDGALRRGGLYVPETSKEKQERIKQGEKDDEEEHKSLEKLARQVNMPRTSGQAALLEDAVRTALGHDSRNRSHVDVQTLKNWFQQTKIQNSTDFDNLHPMELDLLCRRMQKQDFRPNQFVFHQGDEGDALFIVLSGVVEVRVSQIVLGQSVEVTVCELRKNDFFGERSLLNNEPRAATIVAKVKTDLVRISREDYNMMLKQNQQDFLNRVNTNAEPMAGIQLQSNQKLYRKILRKNPHNRTEKDLYTLSKYLQSIKFFREMSLTFTRELCSVVHLVIMAPNTIVFREGEIGELFYIILTGSVDVKIDEIDARGKIQKKKINSLTEGSHFGELALIKSDGKRSASVITVDPCEFLTITSEDYNTILKRVQREDMTDKIAHLRTMRALQAEEWTDQYLEELGYVLEHQRFSTGSVLFTQGDKALCTYFIVRGEVIATKDVINRNTNKTHRIFEQRIGRSRIVGEEPIRSNSFNEVINRQSTITATTPVETLTLSKYDVFHRLSVNVRNELKRVIGLPDPELLTLDRVYKTKKWETYKKNLIKSEIDQTRLQKLCPKPALAAKAATNTTSLLPDTNFPPTIASGADDNNTFSSFFNTRYEDTEKLTKAIENIDRRPSEKATWEIKTPLLDANNLILVSPESSLGKDISTTKIQTMAGYTMSYNPDADANPLNRSDLLGQVVGARHADQRRLKREGNPFVYLKNASHQLVNPPQKPDSSWIVDNFVFSPHKEQKLVATMRRHESMAFRKSVMAQSLKKLNYCGVVNFSNSLLRPYSSKSAFRILGIFPTQAQAYNFVQDCTSGSDKRGSVAPAVRKSSIRRVSLRGQRGPEAAVNKSPEQVIDYHRVALQKFILVPASLDRYYGRNGCHEKLVSIMSSYLGYAGDDLLNSTKARVPSGDAEASSAPSAEFNLYNLLAPSTIINDEDARQALSSSFLSKRRASSIRSIEHDDPQNEKQNIDEWNIPLQDIIKQNVSSQIQKASGLKYACVSILPNPLFIESGSREAGDDELDHEPVFCLHQCFRTENEAINCGREWMLKLENNLRLPIDEHPDLYVCVVPMYQWIYFDEAAVRYRISLSREGSSSRQNQRHMEPTRPTKPKLSTSATANLSTLRKTTSVEEENDPIWKRNQRMGQRLHAEVNKRINASKTSSEKDDSSEFEVDAGKTYSVRNPVSLDQKLDNLEEILKKDRDESSITRKSTAIVNRIHLRLLRSKRSTGMKKVLGSLLTKPEQELNQSILPTPK